VSVGDSNPDPGEAGKEASTEPEFERGLDVPAQREPARNLRPTSRRRRWIGRGLLVAGIVILLSATWVGWRTYQAYRHLNSAAAEVTALQNQVKNLEQIDVSKAGATVASLRALAGDAVDDTSDPFYRAAGILPWIGPNLRAISTIVDTVDELASTTAPALIEVAKTVRGSALAPKNGAIDVAPIVKASASLQAADSQVATAGRTMASIDRGQLVGPVARAVTTLQTKLSSLGTTIGNAARIGRLAPAMLGGTFARKYLVVFQNLAEPRATGGLIGSYALLDVENGRLRIADLGSGSRDLGVFDPPLPLPKALPEALYGRLPGQYATDVNLTPDFPTAAGLLATMYAQRNKVKVDGVLAIDPVALSYLLAGSKPISIGHGLSLTAGNITQILLSTAYFLYPEGSDAPARDIFLADATAKAFAAVTNSPANAAQMLAGLKKGVAEHRVLLWSAIASEQKDLASTALVGSMPASDGTSPTVGVFRNDGTGGKLGYYAAGSAALTAGSCDNGGRRALTVSVHLSYMAPASGLPNYVLGFKRAGAYVLRTNLLIFAPTGGDLSSLTVNGKQIPVIRAEEGGRKVGMVTIDQKPGEAATVTGSLLVPAPSSIARTFAPRIRLTPGVTSWKSSAPEFASC